MLSNVNWCAVHEYEVTFAIMMLRFKVGHSQNSLVSGVELGLRI